ncbi:hypothetical protein FVE85_8688 [Porphyridium purpureum]|uniref:Uncharacterized protein n=1 Tax=Porphyridium purpureum TaxID=35688 RepID=A0A5J4YR28_PORPP|nr:hypothetical protein FVE85_8688 [Porphyridium purpureum]|eukprot:POR4871..scf296_7
MRTLGRPWMRGFRPGSIPASRRGSDASLMACAGWLNVVGVRRLSHGWCRGQGKSVARNVMASSSKGYGLAGFGGNVPTLAARKMMQRMFATSSKSDDKTSASAESAAAGVNSLDAQKKVKKVAAGTRTTPQPASKFQVVQRLTGAAKEEAEVSRANAEGRILLTFPSWFPESAKKLGMRNFLKVLGAFSVLFLVLMPLYKNAGSAVLPSTMKLLRSPGTYSILSGLKRVKKLIKDDKNVHQIVEQDTVLLCMFLLNHTEAPNILEGALEVLLMLAQRNPLALQQIRDRVHLLERFFASVPKPIEAQYESGAAEADGPEEDKYDRARALYRALFTVAVRRGCAQCHRFGMAVYAFGSRDALAAFEGPFVALFGFEIARWRSNAGIGPAFSYSRWDSSRATPNIILDDGTRQRFGNLVCRARCSCRRTGQRYWPFSPA